MTVETEKVAPEPIIDSGVRDPFFIVGADRSGTTLLRLMLNCHPGLAIPPESHFLAPLVRALPTRGPLSEEQVRQAAQIIGGCPRFSGWRTCTKDLGTAFDLLEPPTLAELVDRTFRLEIEPTGKDRWGDKTPMYSFLVDEIADLFPRARFVHIVRDGRDVSLSLKRVAWQGWTEYERSRYWARVIERAESSGARVGDARYLRVSYEALVLHPDVTLARVCSFLDVAMHEAVLSFHETAQLNLTPEEIRDRIHTKLARPSRPSDVQRWRRESASMQVLLFEAVVGRSLERMAYVRRYRGVGRIATVLAAVMYIPFGVSVSALHRVFDRLPESWRSGFRSTRLLRWLKRGVVRC